LAKVASVLIVDDNQRCVEFMKLAFQSCANVDVTAETHPVAVVDRIRADKPDLVMLDIKMPEIDGFQILQTLRGQGITTPVVMCSGSTLQRDVDRAYAMGCNGYVEKPASLDDYRTLAGAIMEYWRRGEAPVN
jgi:CheY-like chemotaxis protein